jgi:hypothetical protein
MLGLTRSLRKPPPIFGDAPSSGERLSSRKAICDDFFPVSLDRFNYKRNDLGTVFCVCIRTEGIFPRQHIYIKGELFSISGLCLGDGYEVNVSRICIPASVTNFDGFAFVNRSSTVIAIEAGSCFVVCGSFIVDLECSSLVRYFGFDNELIISSNIETIVTACFFDTLTITELDFESDSLLREIGELSFCQCRFLRQICIPASVEVLQKKCFHRCESLEILLFESDSQLSRIDEGAFAWCINLKSVCIPALVSTLDAQCFFCCRSLAAITFESGSKLFRIGTSAFDRCSSLVSVCIPASVVVLCRACFGWCDSLAEFEFEPDSQLSQIESFALANCRQLRAICIPAIVSSIDEFALPWASIAQISVEPGNSHFSAAGCFLLDADGIRLIRCVGTLAELNVGPKIQVLSKYAFCRRGVPISSLTFADGSDLRHIEEAAFDDEVMMESIRIPGSIERLDRNWGAARSFRRVIFESGKSLQRALEANPECLNKSWDICIAADDLNLDFGQFRAESVLSDPGFVKLLRC